MSKRSLVLGVTNYSLLQEHLSALTCSTTSIGEGGVKQDNESFLLSFRLTIV